MAVFTENRKFLYGPKELYLESEFAQILTVEA